MSRCFPYPPPYCNESLIESIKLQKKKENAKLEKAKKKEKKAKNKEVKDLKEKNEKKEKKRNQDCYSLKPEPIQLKEQKHKQIFEEKCLLQDAQFYTKKINDGNDLLEGSGVTEEHEPPCSIKQQNSESSESSQDSNKRRKLAAPSLSHNNNGTKLRFKLPISRENDRLVPSLQIGRKKTSEWNSSLPPEIKSQPLSADGKTSQLKVFPVLGVKDVKQINRPTLKYKLAPSTSVDLALSKITRKIDSRPDYLPTLGQKASLPESPPVSVSGQRDPGQKCISPSAPKLKLKVESLQSRKLSAARQGDLQPAVGRNDLKSNFTPIQVEQKFESLPSAGKGIKDLDEQPCFSGRKIEVSHEVKSHKSKSRRHAEERFHELFEGWKHPSLPLDFTDICDEDWLFGASKHQSSSCVDKCKVDDVKASDVRCCISTLQPRASYTPELDMYILPYTIPF